MRRSCKLTNFCCVVWALLSLAVAADAKTAEGFSVDMLPAGSDVTLPSPALTLVPLAQRVKLAATDQPQSVKFSTVVNKSGANPRGIKLSIFDSKTVKFVTLKPGAAYLYNFAGLHSISILPETEGEESLSSDTLQLRVESDKPLNIGR